MPPALREETHFGWSGREGGPLKRRILSDLHVAFGAFVIPEVGADLVVLAGDTHDGSGAVRWILDREVGIPVIYVLGIHVFYRNRFPLLSMR